MEDDTAPRTKVGRVLEEYDLTETRETLEARWTGVSGERTSLRDLADEINKRILEAELRRTGAAPSDFETEGIYEALRHESGSDGIRARRRLERRGVDLDTLTEDFVTHTAVHTYLTEERGASLPSNDRDLIEEKVETINKLKGRMEAVSESAIRSLVNADELQRDDYDLLIDVRIICPSCGKGTPIDDLFQDGGCECEVG